MYFPGLDPDINPDEEEEKHRLISQVLELQNTLDGNLMCTIYYVFINVQNYCLIIETLMV